MQVCSCNLEKGIANRFCLQGLPPLSPMNSYGDINSFLHAFFLEHSEMKSTSDCNSNIVIKGIKSIVR